MTTYIYECENCKAAFEMEQHIKAKPRKKCPDCKKMKLYRVIQPVMGFVKLSDSELKETGHLIGRNTERFSDDYKKVLGEKHRTKKSGGQQLPKGMKRLEPVTEKPWWSKNPKATDKQVSRMTPDQKVNYVEKGIVP